MNKQIYGRGPSGPVMILEDYPSEEEIVKGEALIGSNFNLVRRLFRELQQNPDSHYRTVFCKERSELQVPIRKEKVKYHSKLWVEHKDYFKRMEDQLMQELVEIHPKVIICAGELPLNFLTERRKIFKYRGSILNLADQHILKYPQLQNTYVIPILPLRTLFYKKLFEPVTVWDLAKAFRLLDQPFIHPDKKYIKTVAKTTGDFNDFIMRGGKPEFRTVDIETNNGYITCIGFCINGTEAISVPLIYSPKHELPYLWKAVGYYLSRNIPTVNQNIAYDDWFCQRWGIPINGIVGDTMILSHTIYSELPKGLDFLTSVYTDIEYYKDDVKDVSGINFDPDLYQQRLYLYNATDALTTHIIYPQQLKDAEDLGVKQFYQDKIMPLYFTYRKMQKRGVCVDDTQRKKLLIENEQKLEESVVPFRMLFSEYDFNWDTFVNSSKQVATLVYDILHCPPQFHFIEDAKTGERRKVLSTDEETLEELAINYKLEEGVEELLYKIIIARKYYRICNWLRTPFHPDGRIRSWYNLVGTKSGRTSASEHPDFIYVEDDNKATKEHIGYSFQTIPKHGYELPTGETLGKNLLSIFVPTPGYIFIEGDKSQAEARVVCVLANNLEFLDNFDRPPGVHKLTASWIYNCDPFSIAKTDPRYDIGKRARHAGNYDLRAARLSQMTHLNYATCELILAKFHRADPSIRGVFHQTVRDIVSKERKLETPHGRIRTFFGKLDDELYREAYSLIPQSTVSDDVKFSMRKMLDTHTWIEALIEKHDSLLVEIPTERKNEYIEIWNQSMHQPIDFSKGSIQRNIQLVIPTELMWSDTNLHELKGIEQ